METRVILTTTYDPMYADCAYLVTTAWEKLGYKPTLFVVGNHDEKKEKIRCSERTEYVEIQQIKGLSDGFISQTIRPIVPIFYKEDICITGDIDMIPMSKIYFDKLVRNVKENNMVIATADDYPAYSKRFPMCYFAGKGSVYKHVLKIDQTEKNWLEKTLLSWSSKGFGWGTDEIVFGHILVESNVELVKLNREWIQVSGHRLAKYRIDRASWAETMKNWKTSGFAIDAHLPRPYAECRDFVRDIEKLYGINQ